MGIELNVKNRDIGSFVTEAQKTIRQKIDLPTGYTIAWGGQFENQRRAMSRLLVITPAVVILVLLLLFAPSNATTLRATHSRPA